MHIIIFLQSGSQIQIGTYIVDGLNCTWGSWTEFSTCSAEGTQYRDRVCGSLNPDFSGLWRSRKETVIQSCNPDIPIGRYHKCYFFFVNKSTWRNLNI